MIQYKFIDITDLPPEIEETVLAAATAGTIRTVHEHATGKDYVDGRELHVILCLRHGITNETVP